MRLHLDRSRWVIMLAVALVSSGAATAAAQDAPAPPSPSPIATPEKPKGPPPRASRPGDIQRVFTIEHAGVDDLANVLAIFPVTIKTSDRPRAIGVSGPPAVVAAIEETIKRLDVAPPSGDIELTGYVIRGQTSAQGPDDIPDALSGTVSQMRSLFGYEHFELLDVLVARGAQTTKMVSSGFGTRPIRPGARLSYELSARPELVSQGTSAPSFRMALEVTMHVPVGQPAADGRYAQQRVDMRAVIEARPDQYVVVGKSGLGDDSGDALILVIKARLVD
jgi:hypothetical protein